MRQAGVSLIESLVALLLISIALLGVAGLQLVSLQDGRDARWRVDATSLANGALEQMRAGKKDDVDEFIIGSDQSIKACSGGNAAICDNMTAWIDSVAKTLPHGSAAIEVQDTSGVEHVTVSLRWRQQAPDDDNPLPACGQEASSGGCVILETRL